MFKFIDRNCHRCSGRLTDEFKLDLPGEREIVCINCGNRFWEKRIPGRKSFTDWEIHDCFREDEHRQILKHQSPKSKSRKKVIKHRASGLSPVWTQI